MKKFICSLLLALLGLTTYSQVSTLEEGFESWPPSNWEAYFIGDANDGWRQDFEAISYSGEHSAYSSINNDQCDNWLVTPQILVQSNNYELKFWDYNKTIEFYDKTSVLISTGSGNPEDGEFIEVYTTPTPLNLEFWEERVIDLSSYNGQNIYVAFRYEGTFHQWYLDEVRVSPEVYTDGALTTIVNPTGVSETAGVENVIVTLRNSGTTIVNDVTIDWEINEVPQTAFNATGLNLAPGASTNLILGNFSFAIEGLYTINAALNLADDFDPSNNTIAGNYTIQDFQDGALVQITPEGMVPSAGLLEVNALVKNEGDNTIDNLTVDWSVDGIVQTPFTTTSLNLLPNQTTEVVIGSYDFPSGVNQITAKLNVLGDINPDNDEYVAYAAINTFWESFEGSEWLPLNWEIIFGTKEDINFDTPPQGNYYYDSTSDDNFFGIVQDTIFTPRLDIESGDTFSFYIKDSSFFPSTHDLVSKDPVTGEITVLQTITSTPDVWDLVTYPLTGAEGVNQIGITTSSNSFANARYDLFTSTASLHLYDNDLSIKNGDLYFLAKDGESTSYTCLIKNEGALPALGSNYTVRLMEAPGTVLASVSGVDLDSWEEASITINNTFTGIGEHRLYFEIEYAADENLDNNRFREANVNVVPDNIVLDEMGPKNEINLNFPFNSNGDTFTLGEDDVSQTLYLNTDFESPGDLYGIVYSYNNLLAADYVQHLPLKVYVLQTDRTDLSAGYTPTEELVLVFDGEIEILPGNNRQVYVPFDTPVAFTGIDNIIVQDYQYSPEWPPSIIRFNSTNLASGPVRTIRNFDVFDLDINDLPTSFAQFEDYAYTQFVVSPETGSSVASGIVNDADTGLPIDDATVFIDGTTITTQTDPSGAYTLPELPYGTYNITATKFGYNDQTVETTLNTPTIVQDFNLVPRALVEINGRVVGSNDITVPLENVQIDMEGYVNDNTTSDVDGTFTFATVYGNADYEITFSLYGYKDRTITVPVVDASIDIGDVVLDQEFISPFDVNVLADTEVIVDWKDPYQSGKVKLQNDFDVISTSYTNEPNENVWLGNVFNITDITTITDVEIRTDVFENATDFVTIDVFDLATEEILATSEPFLIEQNAVMTIDIPNIVVYDDIAVAVHWQDNPESTNSLGIDFSDESIPNTAFIKEFGEPIVLFSDYFPGAPNSSFHVRVNTLDDGSPSTNGESLTYNVYRGLASEFPDITSWTLLNSSPVADLSYVDIDWFSTDPLEQYRFAVETIYSEGVSEPTFSNIIDGNVLGLREYFLEDAVTIYPVPAREVLNIQFGSYPTSLTSIDIIDVLGRFVDNIPVTISNNNIVKNVSNLQNGVYFVRLNNGIETITKKFIINR